MILIGRVELTQVTFQYKGYIYQTVIVLLVTNLAKVLMAVHCESHILQSINYAMRRYVGRGSNVLFLVFFNQSLILQSSTQETTWGFISTEKFSLYF